MLKQHRVQLSEAERQQLPQLVASGTTAARVFTHAHILLKPGRDHDPGTASLPRLPVSRLAGS